MIRSIVNELTPYFSFDNLLLPNRKDLADGIPRCTGQTFIREAEERVLTAFLLRNVFQRILTRPFLLLAREFRQKPCSVF